MAKYYSSTFGQISGKHGSAVAVTRKDGTTYIRIYAKPSNPRTDKQQAHRAKFALSSRALVPFNPIFKETIGITNGISSARSYAFKNAIVGKHPSLSVDYEKLMFSFGALEKLHNASISYIDGVATINWDFDKMYNCHSDDIVNIVAFNKDGNQAFHIKEVALRSDKISKIHVRDSWIGSEIYFWAYVTNNDKISDSVFVGKCRPSEIIANKADEVAEQDCASYNAGIESDIPAEDRMCGASSYIGTNDIVVSFIMMLCNLLSLFRQAVIGKDSQYFEEPLIHNVACMVERVHSIANESVLAYGLRLNRRNVFKDLPTKCKNIFASIPIPLQQRGDILNLSNQLMFESIFKNNTGKSLRENRYYLK